MLIALLPTKAFNAKRGVSPMGKAKPVLLILSIAFLLIVNPARHASAMDVTLGWDGNTETDLAGYKIYYGPSHGGPYNGSGSSEGASPVIVPLSLLADRSEPSFTVHGLGDGTHYIVVTAYDAEGMESGYSNEVYTQSSPTPPPPPPQNAAPVLSNFEVNGQSGSSVVQINSRTVDIRIVATDDTLVSQYLVLDGRSDPTGETFVALPGGPRQNPIFAVNGFALNDRDGNHTIYAWVKDNQGVVSAAATKTDVLLDRVAPTVAISYSGSYPYNAGDIITITADFTNSNPLSGAPTITINFAGSGNDVSGVRMTQVGNTRWTYAMSVPTGNDGVATVTISAFDTAGNPVGFSTGSTFVVDNNGPRVVGYPTINYAEASVTITYSEDHIQNGTIANNYSFNSGLTLSGNGMDTSGTGRAFRLPLNPATLQPYFIYTMQIGSAVTDAAGNAVSTNSVRVNDDDNDGMADDWERKWFGSITAKNGSLDSDEDGLSDSSEYGYARSNASWGSNRWALSPLSRDSDGDGIPDQYEVMSGLNPVSASDRGLDLDQDGWTNEQEYVYGFLANDPNSHPQGTVEVVEAIPLHNAGIAPDTSRIPTNTSIAVRLESTHGIDITDPEAVLLSLSDGERTYTRKMNDMNASGQTIVRPIPLDAEDSVATSLWVSYYRTKETSMATQFAYGATVEVTVQAKDVKGTLMEPVFFSFRVEDEQTSNQARTRMPPVTLLEDQPEAGKRTVMVEDGSLKGSAIIYDSVVFEELGFEPTFGPVDEVPLSPGGGVPLNLQPPAVFPEPVTLIIPCPGYSDVSGLPIYYWDGQAWWLACDAAGNVTPEGEGWMVPGSRVNHNKDQQNQGYVEIQVYHFSAAAAAGVTEVSTGEASTGEVSTGVSAVQGSSGGGGSCFISTLWN